MKRGDDHIVRKTLDIQENRRGRGRPHPTWRATVERHEGAKPRTSNCPGQKILETYD